MKTMNLSLKAEGIKNLSKKSKVGKLNKDFSSTQKIAESDKCSIDGDNQQRSISIDSI